MSLAINDLNVPHRLLLGPGPSAVHPRVLRTMSTALIGYLDPEWLTLMDEEQALLRSVFQTKNNLTFPISGTGSAGMETAFCNFVEPGDTVVIGCNGYFSERMCEMARLYGANVKRIEKPWGGVFTKEEIETALIDNKPVKILALVHAETSTGALQPLQGIGDIVHRHGALFLIDCVTSLSGVPLNIDGWGIDIAFSASQKCLGCPPGLSPFTAGDRACEGLRLVLEEGLEDRWFRHQAIAEYLWEKMENLGLKLFVQRERRLPSLSTVCVPDGVDDATVRARLREAYNIDIAGGFGP